MSAILPDSHFVGRDCRAPVPRHFATLIAQLSLRVVIWLASLGAERPPRGGLSISALPFSMSRTIIFIDGFNLYYSRLRGTPFKWLDIAALFPDEILRVQDPSSEVVGVRYFTAPIKASYAKHGAVSE